MRIGCRNNVLRHAIGCCRDAELAKRMGLGQYAITYIPNFVFKDRFVSRAMVIDVMPGLFLSKGYFIWSETYHVAVSLV